MSRLVDPDISKFLESFISVNDPFMIGIEEGLRERNYPIVDRSLGQLLGVLCALRKPKSILEIGSGEGYSGIWMLRSAPDSTEFTGIELKPEPAARARVNLKRAGYGDRARIVTGDAVEILDDLDDKYDMIFIDASKGQYPIFFEKAVIKMTRSGLLVVDNVLIGGYAMPGKQVRHRLKTIQNRMREFINKVKNDERLSSVLVPVSDGVIISIRRDEIE